MPDQTNRSPRQDREGERGEPGSLVAFPRARHPDRPTDNLPLEISSFVGREREIVEIRGLLSERRLLTLHGPGGCGKSDTDFYAAGSKVADSSHADQADSATSAQNADKVDGLDASQLGGSAPLRSARPA